MYGVRNWLLGGFVILALSLAAQDSRGMSVPETITIDSLTKLYDNVKFDHAKHIMDLKDCAVCHHHTTGTLLEDEKCVKCHRNSDETKVVSCKGCHAKEPFTSASLKAKDKKIYHRDKPGLKAAYHQSCLGCHKNMGGPTGCEDCHKRNQEGAAFYNSGAYAPKKSQAKQNGHH